MSYAATGREILALKGHANVVMSATFSPGGSRIATDSWDQTTNIWDAETAQEMFTLKGRSAMVRGVAFSPDGQQVVAGTGPGTLARVWSAAPRP